MINMMKKAPTRHNTQTPFTNFWTAKNLHGSAFSVYATGGTVKFLSCKQYRNLLENLRVPSKRGVYLVWTVQRAFWKRSEQEKQWGEGVRSESRKNSFNGTFQQKFLPDPSGIPDSGKRYVWFILTALVNIRRSITLWKCEVTAMRSSVRRLTFKKVLRPLALLAALRPYGRSAHWFKFN